MACIHVVKPYKRQSMNRAEVNRENWQIKHYHWNQCHNYNNSIARRSINWHKEIRVCTPTLYRVYTGYVPLRKHVVRSLQRMSQPCQQHLGFRTLLAKHCWWYGASAMETSARHCHLVMQTVTSWVCFQNTSGIHIPLAKFGHTHTGQCMM